MFEIGQIKMLPDCIIVEPNNNNNLVLDVHSPIVGTFTTLDDLTFDTTLIVGMFSSSTDVMVLAENANAEWISARIKINAVSVTPFPLGLITLGFGNQNFNPLNFTNNSVQFGFAQGDGAPTDDEVNFQFQTNFGSSSNVQAVAQQDNNITSNNIDIEITLSMKRDGTDFKGTARMNNENNSCGAFVDKDLNGFVNFIEAYPFIVIANIFGLTPTINVTFEYGQNDLNFAKANTQGLLGTALNSIPTVSTPIPQTGQRFNYTPIGRINQDDGGVRAGRLGKTSAYEQNISSGQGTIYSGYVSGQQYNNMTSVSFGTQGGSLNNQVTNIDKICLMYNMSLLQPSFFFAASLAWEDLITDNDIFSLCDACNAANLSGHNDWRVANLFEVLLMLNYFNFSAGLVVQFPTFNLTDVGLVTILTSTTYIANTTECYAVTNTGLVINVNKTLLSSTNACVLVRDLPRDTQL